ncbi:MAG: class I SAM-dependent methyltransferase [Rhodospirillales bacterium]|nr:class I SAM-dependent methyltransferase [Rhodospirillales bacterium]
MGNSIQKAGESRHLRISEPSPWVRRHAPLIPKDGPSGGRVLDLAAGGGRHARYLLEMGYRVTAVDRSLEGLAKLENLPDMEVLQVDLEDETPWPFKGRVFAGIVVVNYLHRPLFPLLLDCLEPNGVLIYETFSRGNEQFTRPRNPDHLLKSGELLQLAEGRLQVVAYEHGIFEKYPCPGVIQHICAVNDLALSTRDDNEPPAHPFRKGDGTISE